ncbi:hypothetical protein [Nonomuraea basaltis]|uniref:hypothetical protein n=1 Tax=Nonomuraea basaltis TaxID=2495887 RepID=UPI00110C4F4A|nr:hypothetical protein [Nonomuraea basaltis]TMR91700.1 hypothetical protein EJK15_48620 [Nonomuraea basaltis]
MVVDGRPELVGAPPVPLLVWGAAVLVAWTAGQMVVFPATVVLAAGVLAGRPVSVARDAGRGTAAARHVPGHRRRTGRPLWWRAAPAARHLAAWSSS